MSDHQSPNPNGQPQSAFDSLIGSSAAAAVGGSFTTAFRGYDKDEVDAAISSLNARLRAETAEVAFLEESFRRASETADVQSRERVERLQAQLSAANARANAAEEKAEADERLQAELDETRRRAVEAEERASAAEAQAQDAAAAAAAEQRGLVDRLETELAAANARVATAEQSVQALSDELVASPQTGGESAGRQQFEEVLRVAEEQASVLIRNASVQAERLLDAAREEITNRRNDVQAEAEAVRTQSHHEAQQARLRIETELTAHAAQMEREAAHAAEKVAQAEQEAAAIRSEAEKGAAALRSMVARETTHARAEAEEAVRELRVRALEFEESLSRRQDDAQQEFLVLHNQAVAHAERITTDANEQVAASLEHAQRVAAKTDDFEKLMRAQAQQIEADASMRAREHLDRARDKAQKIIAMVTTHSQSVLRDAEDRTRQLRWQQHQLTSFMAEVKELIRPEAPASDPVDGDTIAAALAAAPWEITPEELRGEEAATDAPEADGGDAAEGEDAADIEGEVAADAEASGEVLDAGEAEHAHESEGADEAHVSSTM